MTTTLTAQETRHSWVPYVALAAGAGLLLKAALIFATEDKIDTPAALLYLGSLLLALAAAIGQGLRSRPGRRTLVAIGLSLALIAWVMGIGDLLTPAFELISKRAYVGDEGPIALLGLVLVILGARGRSAD